MRVLTILTAVLLSLAIATPAAAQKPDGAGQGKGQGQGQGQGGGKGKSGQAGGKGQGQQGQGGGQAAGQQTPPSRHVVVERDQRIIYDYYGREFQTGNCPPGLAKKNNGCLPPGQAKKLWAIGQPLPRDVIYYPLPQGLVIQLAAPPAGYLYVRVADDVLLMQRANRLVVDAVINLNRF